MQEYEVEFYNNSNDEVRKTKILAYDYGDAESKSLFIADRMKNNPWDTTWYPCVILNEEQSSQTLV